MLAVHDIKLPSYLVSSCLAVQLHWQTLTVYIDTLMISGGLLSLIHIVSTSTMMYKINKKCLYAAGEWVLSVLTDNSLCIK